MALYVCCEVSSKGRPDTHDLFKAIIADSRFDETDWSTIVEMMELLHEGFPIPKDISWFGDFEHRPKKAVQQQLLSSWRNILLPLRTAGKIVNPYRGYGAKPRLNTAPHLLPRLLA